MALQRQYIDLCNYNSQTYFDTEKAWRVENFITELADRNNGWSGPNFVFEELVLTEDDYKERMEALLHVFHNSLHTKKVPISHLNMKTFSEVFDFAFTSCELDLKFSLIDENDGVFACILVRMLKSRSLNLKGLRLLDTILFAFFKEYREETYRNSKTRQTWQHRQSIIRSWLSRSDMEIYLQHSNCKEGKARELCLELSSRLLNVFASNQYQNE